MGSTSRPSPRRHRRLSLPIGRSFSHPRHLATLPIGTATFQPDHRLRIFPAAFLSSEDPNDPPPADANPDPNPIKPTPDLLDLTPRFPLKDRRRKSVALRRPKEKLDNGLRRL
jgi:hypothetical protein